MDLHSIANTSTEQAALEYKLDGVRVQLHKRDHEIRVDTRPVNEAACYELQRSQQYPAGLALRFARVKRHRQDKTALQADTLHTVRQIAEMGFRGAAA